MIIRCICINDSNKPKEIPERKWVRKGAFYTLSYATRVEPQGYLGLQFKEIELGEECFPYEYFISDRFYFDSFDRIHSLPEFINRCHIANQETENLLIEMGL